MRNYFFEKGQQLQTAQGNFFIAPNKLDSQNYALQRVENPPDDYVTDLYTSFEHRNFLRYYTCWEQTESVPVKPEKQQKKEVKANKKKSLNMFLTRKKNEQTDNSLKNDPHNNRPKKQIDTKKEEMHKVKVLYVQVECFKKVEFPTDMQALKKTLAVIYLLAQSVEKELGFWPSMEPVLNNEGNFRFIKKGKTRHEQLRKLFEIAITGKPLEQWSEYMQSIYEMYKINRDVNLLAQRVHYDLQKIISAEYQIKLSIQGKIIEQTAKIVDIEYLRLVNSDIQLPLDEFIISFYFKDQKIRQVTLQHPIFDPIVIEGNSSNFIIKYLKAFRSK